MIFFPIIIIPTFVLLGLLSRKNWNSFILLTTSSPFFQTMHRQHGHGVIVCDGDDERALRGNEDIVDTLVEPSYDNSRPRSGAPTQTEDLLQCPKCEKGYPVARHEGFLEHIDVCGVSVRM